MTGFPEIPFNTGYSFNDDLRDVPDAAEQMSAAVRHLEARLASSDHSPSERIRMLGMLGGFCRMLGRLDEAETHITAALALAREREDSRAVLANEIRLAHVYQWKRDFSRADALFEKVIHDCEQQPELAAYLDFAYQHYGKSKFDQGAYQHAAAYFEKAIALRENRNAPPDQIESSRLALVTAHQGLAQSRSKAS